MKNNEKFQTDVEMVPKALRDQAQTREPEEEATGLYRKFTTTKQEPVRRKDADGQNAAAG